VSLNALRSAEGLLVDVATAESVSVDRVRRFLESVIALAADVALAADLLGHIEDTDAGPLAIERAVRLATEVLAARPVALETVATSTSDRRRR
jgi:hypothetical protein